MDVDGSSIPGEIDQNLLLQFSCMNTTDREELINQMQRLLGPSLNHNTASFFLDMSNWNLQAAICCYLDYTLPPKLPSMSLTAAQNQETAVGPGTRLNRTSELKAVNKELQQLSVKQNAVPSFVYRFAQHWSLANTGTEAWPGSCRLVQAGGEPFGATPQYMPPLAPGHSTTVALQLTAPSTAGTHRGYFHLLTEKGEQIGDTLWVEITVESEMTTALVEQLAALPFPSNRIDESIPQMPPQDDQMC